MSGNHAKRDQSNNTKNRQNINLYRCVVLSQIENKKEVSLPV
jgi:hypothetical protein